MDRTGLLMFIDFEKAFDSIEWAFMERDLTYFKFEPSLVNPVQIILQWCLQCYENNEWVSESITLGRRVRQRYPMSPYLFIISAEILANFIRRDKDVKGFMTWSRAQTKPIRWWHDVILILDGSEGSFLRAIEGSRWFQVTSDLKVNYEKTKVLWVGLAKEKSDHISSNINKVNNFICKIILFI